MFYKWTDKLTKKFSGDISITVDKRDANLIKRYKSTLNVRLEKKVKNEKKS